MKLLGSRPLRTLGAVAVLVLLPGTLLARFAVRREAAAAHAAYTRTARMVGADPAPLAAVPAPENAAAYLRAAASLIERTDPELREITELGESDPATWPEDAPARIARVRARYAEAVRLARRAAALRRSSFGLGLARLDQPSPPCLDLLWLGRLLAASARLELGRGAWDRARQDLAALAAIAETLEREKVLIAPLVGFAVEGTLERVLRDAAAAGRLPGELAARIVLPERDPVRAVRDALAAEHDMLARRENLREVLLGAGSDGRPGPWRRLRVTAADLLGLLGREQAQLDRAYAAALGATEAPFPALAERWSSGSGWISEWMGRETLRSAVGRAQATLAARRLARAALAVLAESERAGGYPPELPGGPLPEEPFCGCRPRYTLAADGSAVLELPGAEELDRRLMEPLEVRHALRWSLPPPAGGGRG